MPAVTAASARPRLEPVLPRRHHQAGGEALDVPFERSGQGLVEVAQVERQVPFRRGPQAEVEDVRVPAELDRQPAVGLRAQVARHHRRGPPVVVPRGERHPVMPDGDELGNPDLVLVQDRLSASCPRSSSSHCPSPRRRARCLAAFPSARLSSIVADRSCTTTGDCDRGGPDIVIDRTFPDDIDQTPRIATERDQLTPAGSPTSAGTKLERCTLGARRAASSSSSDSKLCALTTASQ